MIGKWEADYVTSYFYKNNVLGQELKTYLDAGTVVLQINDGGTGIYTESGNDYLFSWSLSGTSLTISNLMMDPIVLELSVDGDLLLWAWPKQTDTQDTSVTYQDVFTGKRIG